MIEIIRNLEITPHVLFHVSSKQFDFPCRQKINEAREWSEWHANGVLGLWCSTFPKQCAAFGSYVYEVEMSLDAREIGLPFSDFQRLTSNMEDFSDLIEFLCKEGDVAYLIDANPYVGEVIVLNFDKIVGFKDRSGFDLQDNRVPLKVAA